MDAAGYAGACGANVWKRKHLEAGLRVGREMEPSRVWRLASLEPHNIN
jgi:hypothetical protein